MLSVYIYNIGIRVYVIYAYRTMGVIIILKFKRYINFPCSYYLSNILLYISLVFELFEAVFHSFTKTGLFYINILRASLII